MKKQEQEVLETQSIPLRNYLMKHVMPTLSQALIECCKTRPEDPVDYVVSHEQYPQGIKLMIIDLLVLKLAVMIAC